MCFYNNREFRGDTARFINKFDIFICDLGSGDDDILLNKSRPCLIIQSDDINCPVSSQYLIAPIRTEHNLEVSRETVEDIVLQKRSIGRYYVPIEMSSDDFRFIDLTQIRPVSSSKVKAYLSTIINSELKNRINATIMDVFFSRNEFIIGDACEVSNEIECNVEVKEIEEQKIEETVDEPKKKTKSKRKSSFPMGFSKYYQLYEKGEITVSKLAEKIGKPKSTTYYYLKRYKELHPEIAEKQK